MNKLNKDKDYHSYTSIKRFIEEGPISLITEKNSSNKGIRDGSLLDDMMYLLEDFYSKYHVKDVINKLNSMETKLFNDLIIKIDNEFEKEDVNSDRFDDICNKVIEEKDYFITDRKKKNSKALISQRIEYIRENYLDYLEFQNKIRINPVQYNKILELSKKLKESKSTLKYFDNSNIESYQNIYQVNFKFIKDNVKYKVILDQIHIDHKNKTVQVADLKYTSFLMSKFENEIWKYKYYIQSTIYTEGLIEYVKDIDNNLNGYTVLEPVIIAVNNQELPELFTISRYSMYCIKYGYSNDFGKYVKGINKYISEIEWHIKNNKFDHSMSYYKTSFNRFSVGSRYEEMGDSLNGVNKLKSKLLYETSKDNLQDEIENIRFANEDSTISGKPAFLKNKYDTIRKSTHSQILKGLKKSLLDEMNADKYRSFNKSSFEDMKIDYEK